MGLLHLSIIAETELAGRGPSNTAILLFALGTLVLTATLLLRLRRKMREREEEAGVRPSRVPRDGSGERRMTPLDASRQQRTLEALMVEVQELTRLCAAQMENRAVRLEKLIREADDRLARLESHTGMRQESVRVPERSGASSAFLRKGADPLTARIYELADQGVASVEIARELEEHTGKVDLILALRDR